jgi:hypothetical protein
LQSSSISAFNLFGKTVTRDECLKAEALIKMNYGAEYPAEKFLMLWEMILEEKWTAERLTNTVKWFLKNKKFPNWTIADWFDYDVKLYNYAWYLEQVNKFGKQVNDQIERYKVDGVVLHKYKDGIELPLERVK